MTSKPHKKGKSFMCEDDRLQIVSQIKGVDEAVTFMSIDDDKTVCKTLDLLRPDIFANGGDRSNSEIQNLKYVKIMARKSLMVWEKNSIIFRTYWH